MSGKGQNSIRRPMLGMSRFARTSLGSSVGYIRKQIWTWPLIMAMIMACVGMVVYLQIESAIKSELQSKLQTILDADVTALSIWLDDQKEFVHVAASSPLIQETLQKFVEENSVKEQLNPDELRSAPGQELISSIWGPFVRGLGYVNYELVDSKRRILSSSMSELIGLPSTELETVFFRDAMAGTTFVTTPYLWQPGLRDENGRIQPDRPSMVVATPILNRSGESIAVFLLRIDPSVTFSEILQVARPGESGETYVFNANGQILSSSRFVNQLARIGLIPDADQTDTILSLEIRDPGVDLTAGEHPELRRKEQPLTYMAQEAIAGRNGVDVDGYRDYRGVPVVGAWKWLDAYQMGITTEVDVAEAYHPLYILRRASWAMLAMLILGSMILFGYSSVVLRMERRLKEATLEARQLGQYTLTKKIGEGGMGTVYRANHALLQRPTAVKLLNTQNTSAESIRRFEREVRLTSQLTHPNTIAIYDFGHTPEGIFYYAMEYLEGITLDELIKSHGPLPEERVLYMLRQAAGSLAEAHAQGIIHRDIKPQNLMTTRRGGIYDFVKVLDFGLVKVIDHSKQASMTSANAMTGTPLYMPPEVINMAEAVCPASDVYSLGAVAYFALTGKHVFEGESVMEICMKHVKTPVELPSKRTGRFINPGLEDLVVRCLAKSTSERPANADELRRELEQLELTHSWSSDDAKQWWNASYDPDLSAAIRETGSTNVTDNTIVVSRN